MLKKLYALVEGYLQLKITGRHMEKLINLLMRNGFKLWNIIRRGDTLYVNIKLKDFKQVRKYIRRVDCKVEVSKRSGLPFWLNKLISRRALIIGFIILILSVYTLSSFVLFIEVKGTKKVKEKEVAKLLQQLKVYPGVLKSSIPIEKLEKLLIEKIPRFAWVNLYFQGTKLIVEVAEKKIVDSTINPSDLVANKAGMISKLIVLKGTAVVKEGMTVKRGDLLISKDVLMKKEEDVISEEDPEEENEDLKVQKKEVKAEGIIKAKVWYEGYGEAKLFKNYYQPTGNQVTSLIIKFNNNEFHIKGPKRPPYSNFKVDKEVKSLPKWRNINLPIELVTRRYIEVKELQEKRKIGIAKKIAKEEAIESVLKGLGKEAIILNSKLNLIESNREDNNIIRVKVLVEVEEDIGIRRE